MPGGSSKSSRPIQFRIGGLTFLVALAALALGTFRAWQRHPTTTQGRSYAIASDVLGAWKSRRDAHPPTRGGPDLGLTGFAVIACALLVRGAWSKAKQKASANPHSATSLPEGLTNGSVENNG